MRSEENRKFQLSRKKRNSKNIPIKTPSEPERTSMDSKFKAPSREDLHDRPLWSHWASRKDSNLAIEALFYWDCLEEDVKQFCRIRLHCIGSLDSKVPRPLGEALHASRRNQVIHYDFLFVKNTRKFSYFLVLKDGLSHFVELIPSERTDHVAVAHALVDWYKRFGVAHTHVIYKGCDFKNKVVAELNDILKTKHHFTTAYSPKSNGTVERVNGEIMKVLRSLVSELKISWNEWASLLPTFGAECLEQLQVGKSCRTSSYHSFHWSSCVQSSCNCSPRL
jgi:hypothetical protein